MVWPVLAAAIGAGLGLAKSEMTDKPAEKRQRKLQAEIARYSPWTHMQADTSQIKPADPFGSMLQGGMAGGMMGQQMGGGAGGAASAVPTVAAAQQSSLTGGMSQDPMLQPGYQGSTPQEYQQWLELQRIRNG